MDRLGTHGEEAFDRLTRLACRALDVPVALVTLLSEDRQVFKSQRGLPEPWASAREAPLSHSFCRHAVDSGEPLIIEDAREHPLVKDSPAIAELGVIAYAGIPLHGRDGPLGALCAIDHQPRQWSPDEIEILGDLAAAASAEIEWRAAREAEGRFRALAESASEAILTMDADSVILSANPAVEQIFGYAAPELLGQPLSILIPERFREAHAAGVRRYLQTGKRGIPWKGVELPGLTRSGEEIPVEISFGQYTHEGAPVFTGFIRDVRERKRAQEESDFLGEASRVLSSTLDYQATLASVARLAVARIADWCGVDLLEENEVRRVAVAHADPAKESVARELLRYPFAADAPGGTPQVIRTGEPTLYPEVPDALLEAVAQDPGHRRILRSLGLRSAVVVPLIARGQTLGAISLVSAESGRRYGPRDLALAEELARRASVAVDQARLFRQTEDARDALEHLTIELEIQMEELQNQATQLEENQVELEMANEDLQRANREFAAADAHYRRLVETSPFGVFVLDAQGQFTEVNAAGAEIVGRSAGEMIGQHFGGLIAPEDLDTARDAFVRVISGQQARLELEPWIQRPSGERRLLHVVITAIREDGGIAGIHGVSREITDERHIQEALQESEKSYRTLFDSLTELVYIQALDGRFLNVNEAVLRRYGYSREEVLGRGPDLLADFRRTDLASVQDRFRMAVKGEPQRFEFWGRTKDGESFPKEITFTRGRYFGQDVVISVARDITQQKRAEAELQQSEDRLRQAQKMEAIGRLSGGIAHDFNNVLSVIKGRSAIALMDLPEESEFYEDLVEIDQAADRAANLTRQLLAFSRQQVLQPEVLNVNEIISEMEKMLRRTLGEDIEFATVLEPELGHVEADPGQIEQILMNLAVNARDAMPTGGKLITETRNVELSDSYAAQFGYEVQPGRYVLLSVSDTGTGMSRGVRERIFEPFFTTKPQGKGTGMGLSTVYGIVKQSGGYVWVYSEPGQGTTFKVYLPRVDAELPEAEKMSGRGALPQHVTILLVEDEPAVRSTARRMLERMGHTVLEAGNGEEALKVAEEQVGEIDLLLTDVVMPLMGGRELVERLRSQRPGLRVLYTSGYTDEAVIRHGVLEGSAAFLQKPYQPAALAEKIAEALDRPGGDT